MKLLFRLTGGRPMIRDSYAFTDRISCTPIFRWTDRLGRKWLAEGPWAIFRVRNE